MFPAGRMTRNYRRGCGVAGEGREGVKQARRGAAAAADEPPTEAPSPGRRPALRPNGRAGMPLSSPRFCHKGERVIKGPCILQR